MTQRHGHEADGLGSLVYSAHRPQKKISEAERGQLTLQAVTGLPGTARWRVGPLDALRLHFCRPENPERLTKRTNRNGFPDDNRKTYMVWYQSCDAIGRYT